MIKPTVDLIFKGLYAKALGDYVISCLNLATPEELGFYMQLNAVTALAEIKDILDDESQDDVSCFRRIDAIVSAFHEQGLSTTRHDF